MGDRFGGSNDVRVFWENGCRVYSDEKLEGHGGGVVCIIDLVYKIEVLVLLG